MGTQAANSTGEGIGMADLSTSTDNDEGVICPSRKIDEHKDARLSFVGEPRHGAEMVCSVLACRESGRRWTWCAKCSKPFAQRNFKHIHGDLTVPHRTGWIARRPGDPPQPRLEQRVEVLEEQVQLLSSYNGLDFDGVLDADTSAAPLDGTTETVVLDTSQLMAPALAAGSNGPAAKRTREAHDRAYWYPKVGARRGRPWASHARAARAAREPD